MGALELAATITGLACVWLTVRQNIGCWPVGLVMVILYMIIFWRVRLYSDMGLQVVYVFLQLYGWYHWLYGGPRQGRLVVTRLRRFEALAWLGTAIIGTGALGLTMATLTDAALPYWDASTTVLSLIAQWLLARKVLESWLVWIAVDILSLGIYANKGLYLTMVLYAAFLSLATLGFFEWRRNLLAPQPA